MCGVPHDIFPHLWQEMVLVFSCIQEFLNIPSKPYFLVNYTWCTWYLCSMHVMYIKTICCVVHMYTIYTYSILFNHVHNYIWYDNSDILLLHIHTLHYIIIYIYIQLYLYIHTQHYLDMDQQCDTSGFATQSPGQCAFCGPFWPRSPAPWCWQLLCTSVKRHHGAASGYFIITTLW